MVANSGASKILYKGHQLVVRCLGWTGRATRPTYLMKYRSTATVSNAKNNLSFSIEERKVKLSDGKEVVTQVKVYKTLDNSPGIYNVGFSSSRRSPE